MKNRVMKLCRNRCTGGERIAGWPYLGAHDGPGFSDGIGEKTFLDQSGSVVKSNHEEFHFIMPGHLLFERVPIQ